MDYLKPGHGVKVAKFSMKNIFNAEVFKAARVSGNAIKFDTNHKVMVSRHNDGLLYADFICGNNVEESWKLGNQRIAADVWGWIANVARVWFTERTSVEMEAESEPETLSSEEEYMVAEAVAEAYNQSDIIMNSDWMEGEAEYMETVASEVLGREIELSRESLYGIWEAAYGLWTNMVAADLAADAEKDIDEILSDIDLCGKASYNYWVAIEKADPSNIEAFRNNLACLESAKARFEKYYTDLGNALGCEISPEDGFQLNFGEDLAGMVEMDYYGWYNFDDLASEYEDAIYRIESALAA